MSFYDLTFEELQTYKPARTEPDDFDAFWASSLEDARQHSLAPRFVQVDYGLRAIESYDVTFSGYGGQPIKGWLMLPSHREGASPCIVEYIGYGGGRSFPTDWLTWAASGFAHLIMDTRGQGSAWRKGDTADLPMEGANPFFPGFMTQGVLDPKTYYYRRVFVDGVRAIETARSHSAVDASRIAVMGGSQGGGITLAMAGLAPDVNLAMPDVPFLCHYRRATEIIDTSPYNEIARYCQVHRDQIDTVFKTLDYFDGVNFATRARASALFSVALMDQICPPSTVYAAFNYYAGAKDIRVWRYNGHEGGESYQTLEKIKFAQGAWM